ncbi:hypothetical protein AgCh_009411 [Apium graveolens]
MTRYIFGDFNDLLYAMDKDDTNLHPRYLMEGFRMAIEDCGLTELDLKDNVEKLTDFRPIALCNILYKIVAKVLENRQKDILSDVIADNQSAFVLGRNISDNVLVAFELLHFMKRKNRGSEGEVALKLDISKAYDRVDWRYLQKRMKVMGFSDKCIKWIMLCVIYVSYMINFNGKLVGPIVPSRGLRQGDPLSPYLFLFCVEGLSQSINKAAEDGDISGCQIVTNAPSVTHLLFADDKFLFFKATKLEAASVKRLLNRYEADSGQAVNYQKYGVFFSANVRLDKQNEIKRILEVNNELKDSKYLGLPSFVGRSKKAVFNCVKERIWRRVQDWNHKTLSKVEKTVMVKNVGQSIPTYSMSSFFMPKTLCIEIERMLNGYWWGSTGNNSKGIRWAAWDKMVLPKCKGGLGFRDLNDFNLALLGKNVWNFYCSRPNSLVTRLFKARYFPGKSILHAATGVGPSFVWTGIWEVKEQLKNGFRWVLGDGESIRIYKDPWLKGKRDFCMEDSHMNNGRNEKVRMTMFLEATDPEYLDRIKEGPHKPTKLAVAVAGEAAKTVPKEKSDYTAEDIASIAKDAKVRHLLHSAIDNIMSNRVINCKTAKEIWDALETRCQGTETIKKNRKTILTQEYEHFDSKINESLNDLYDRFVKLLNDLSLVDKEYDLEDSNLKFLLALPD